MITSQERGAVNLEYPSENAGPYTLFESSISLVVPVYNSEATLVELTTRISDVLTPLVQCFEIILVNDGSQDGSWKVITGLAEQNPNIRGLNLMHNYGQHNALLAGIEGAV